MATISSDGTPQVSAVWIGLDGDLITFNTAEGRVKPKDLRNNPSVAISIAGQESPYESVIAPQKVNHMNP